MPDNFIKTIGHAGAPVPADWITHPGWSNRLASVVFPKNPRSIKRGTRLVYYASGTRRFCAVMEVLVDEPTVVDEGGRWPYEMALRPLVAMPADESAPSLEDVGFSPLRVRRQSHVRLTDEEFVTITDHLVASIKRSVQR